MKPFRRFLCDRIEIESCLQVMCCPVYHWLSVCRQWIYHSCLALVLYPLQNWLQPVIYWAANHCSTNPFLKRKEKRKYGYTLRWGGLVVWWCLVNFQYWGVLLIWIIVGQGPIALAAGADGVVWTFVFISLVYLFSFLSPSLGDGPI